MLFSPSEMFGGFPGWFPGARQTVFGGRAKLI